jgi:hypothetical protein
MLSQLTFEKRKRILKGYWKTESVTWYRGAEEISFYGVCSGYLGHL